MTIREAIERADRQQPNSIDFREKVRWLSQLDHMAWREVIAAHRDPEPADFGGYNDGTEQETRLLIDGPDAEDVYKYWLWWHMDEQTGELEKYNADVVRFNAAYQTWADWYNRTHQPVTAARIRW